MDPANAASIVVSILSVAGVLIANRFTSKQANQAQAIERDKLEQEKEESWRADNIELRRQRAEDKVAYLTSIKELTDRVDMLELDAQVSQKERRAMVTWARRIVDLLKQNGIQYPPPPPGMMDTDPGIPRVR